MSDVVMYHQSFDASPETCRWARRATATVLEQFGHERLIEDAELCVAELACNAILHTGSPFDLVIGRAPGGVRLEVLDHRPDLVPLPVPATGPAVGVTDSATTGRGLRLLAGVAARWGYTRGPTSKTVWCELGPSRSEGSSGPVVVDGYRGATETGRPFELRSLPVRAALASGVQVEDVVREFQLFGTNGQPSDEESAQLAELLGVSAPARLLGRHNAFVAAADGQARFTFTVRLTPPLLEAFPALNILLTALGERSGSGAEPPSPEVLEFRQWVMDEVARQLAGAGPATCPLPD
jgi:anti-sigma regulatory factor (Ser/Thr protein kinase)